MRAALYSLLSEDPELLPLIHGNVFPNYGMDTVPVQNQTFVVVRYAERETNPGIHRGPRIVEFWAHIPKAISTDFSDLDVILDRIEELVKNATHLAGSDGYTITSTVFQGGGNDFYDDQYETIARNISFKVLSRKS